VLQSWATLIEEEQIPRTTLHGAFSSPVLGHLKAAYGWFLLELAGQDVGPDDGLPACCADLADPDTGKVVAPEIRELAQLEEGGFLSILVSGDAPGAVRLASGNNLAAAAIQGADYHEFHECAGSFAVLCERMRNSLDEY
jgi:hypothetical protein